VKSTVEVVGEKGGWIKGGDCMELLVLGGVIGNWTGGGEKTGSGGGFGGRVAWPTTLFRCLFLAGRRKFYVRTVPMTEGTPQGGSLAGSLL